MEQQEEGIAGSGENVAATEPNLWLLLQQQRRQHRFLRLQVRNTITVRDRAAEGGGDAGRQENDVQGYKLHA